MINTKCAYSHVVIGGVLFGSISCSPPVPSATPYHHGGHTPSRLPSSLTDYIPFALFLPPLISRASMYIHVIFGFATEQSICVRGTLPMAPTPSYPKLAPLLRRWYSKRATNRSCTHSIYTRSLRPGSSVERSYGTTLRVARRYHYDSMSRLGSEPRYINCHRSRLCALPRHYRLDPSNRLRGVFKYTLDRYLVPLRGRRFVF